MHILSPETDNCPSWISGRERMTVENISWSISTKECCRPRRGLNPRPPGLQSDGASNWATEAGTFPYKPQSYNFLVFRLKPLYFYLLYRSKCCWYSFELLWQVKAFQMSTKKHMLFIKKNQKQNCINIIKYTPHKVLRWSFLKVYPKYRWIHILQQVFQVILKNLSAWCGN